MPAEPWWKDDPTERYWIEFTDRDDLGDDLRAPSVDESGRDNWHYSLFKLAAPGDIVFHYHTPADAIISASRIAGPWHPQSIKWGARGTYAKAKGVKPHERPGYVVPLVDYALLAAPLTLEALREGEQNLREILASLRAHHPKHPIYFPFELGGRPVRPLQGYAFKLPRDFVLAFPELIVGEVVAPTNLKDDQADAVTMNAALGKPSKGGGQGYGAPQEVKDAVELYSMKAAEAYFTDRGYEIEDVHRTRPYDLIARKGQEELTIEVKGTTTGAESVLLTRNEVSHARAFPSMAVLFIWHSIEVLWTSGVVSASSGEARVYWPWDIDAGTLEALQFKYVPPCRAFDPS